MAFRRPRYNKAATITRPPVRGCRERLGEARGTPRARSWEAEGGLGGPQPWAVCFLGPTWRGLRGARRDPLGRLNGLPRCDQWWPAHSNLYLPSPRRCLSGPLRCDLCALLGLFGTSSCGLRGLLPDLPNGSVRGAGERPREVPPTVSPESRTGDSADSRRQSLRRPNDLPQTDNPPGKYFTDSRF